MKLNRSFSIVLIVLCTTCALLPVGHVVAKTTSSPLDLEIDHLRALYSLAEGWDLSTRASSSLSAQYSGLLSALNHRWRHHLVDSSAMYRMDSSSPRGLQLTSDKIASVAKGAGPEAVSRLLAWQRISQVSATLPIEAKLNLVNKFFNVVAFSSDEENWGRQDYWSSPIELLVRNAGDCEDYAIAKYMTLAAMGVPIDQMRIVYAKSTSSSSAHMVLAYYEPGTREPYILDNTRDKIAKATERKDLIPIFSFNG